MSWRCCTAGMVAYPGPCPWHDVSPMIPSARDAGTFQLRPEIRKAIAGIAALKYPVQPVPTDLVHLVPTREEQDTMDGSTGAASQTRAPDDFPPDAADIHELAEMQGTPAFSEFTENAQVRELRGKISRAQEVAAEHRRRASAADDVVQGLREALHNAGRHAEDAERPVPAGLAGGR